MLLQPGLVIHKLHVVIQKVHIVKRCHPGNQHPPTIAYCREGMSDSIANIPPSLRTVVMGCQFDSQHLLRMHIVVKGWQVASQHPPNKAYCSMGDTSFTANMPLKITVWLFKRQDRAPKKSLLIDRL